VEKQNWQNTHDIKQMYGDASIIGSNRVVVSLNSRGVFHFGYNSLLAPASSQNQFCTYIENSNCPTTRGAIIWDHKNAQSLSKLSA
jgi:HigB_toxin, RelE-like toxic component of a toxin-antitoxin system